MIIFWDLVYELVPSVNIGMFQDDFIKNVGDIFFLLIEKLNILNIFNEDFNRDLFHQFKENHLYYFPSFIL